MYKKIVLGVLLVLTIVITSLSFVYADISTSFPSSGGSSIQKVDNSVKRVWGTVTTVVQILAFAAVVFAGLRYMFASADKKADIKNGLIMLAIGAVLVFASSTVISFVVNVANTTLK